jgi:hypothetical protein
MINSIKAAFSPGKPAFVLIEAAWFGLIFGFAESLILAIFIYGRGKLIYRPEEFVWMIPMIDMILMTTIGLFIMVGSLFWKKLLDQRIVVTLFSALGGISLYYIKPKISVVAAIILVLGISVNLGILANKHFIWFSKVILTSFPWLFIILGIDVVLSFVIL